MCVERSTQVQLGCSEWIQSVEIQLATHRLSWTQVANVTICHQSMSDPAQYLPDTEFLIWNKNANCLSCGNKR